MSTTWQTYSRPYFLLKSSPVVCAFVVRCTSWPLWVYNASKFSRIIISLSKFRMFYHWKKDSSSGLFTICIGLLFYSTIDIFIVMFLGNEIKISSTRLLYCLFESSWMEQTETCKRKMIILSEVLKRHKLIMVAKLYPLNLEVFNSVSLIELQSIRNNSKASFSTHFHRLWEARTACLTFWEACEHWGSSFLPIHFLCIARNIVQTQSTLNKITNKIQNKF